MTDLFLQRDLTVAKRLKVFNCPMSAYDWAMHRWNEALKVTLNCRVIQWLGMRKPLV